MGGITLISSSRQVIRLLKQFSRTAEIRSKDYGYYLYTYHTEYRISHRIFSNLLKKEVIKEKDPSVDGFIKIYVLNTKA